MWWPRQIVEGQSRHTMDPWPRVTVITRIRIFTGSGGGGVAGVSVSVDAGFGGEGCVYGWVY
jgi:hypothetical protein